MNPEINTTEAKAPGAGYPFSLPPTSRRRPRGREKTSLRPPRTDHSSVVSGKPRGSIEGKPAGQRRSICDEFNHLQRSRAIKRTDVLNTMLIFTKCFIEMKFRPCFNRAEASRARTDVQRDLGKGRTRRGRREEGEESYPARIRTWKNRTKTCCDTVSPPGKRATTITQGPREGKPNLPEKLRPGFFGLCTPGSPTGC